MKIIKPHSGKAFASAVVTAALVITPTAVAFASDESTPEVVTSEEAAPQVELESTDPAPTQEQAKQEDVVQTPTEEVEPPAPVSEDTTQVPEQTTQEAPAVQPESISVPLSEPVEPPAPADVTKPTVTVKPESVVSNGVYKSIGFKLFDAGKIDKVTLNGAEKNLSDNVWSDLNGVKPGVFGAVEGENTLVAFDVAGNAAEFKFVLDASGPIISVKPESVGGTDNIFQSASFKLNDKALVDRITLNGAEKNLSDNVWSDLNGVKPGVFGAVEGENTLVAFDALGNSSTLIFVLDTIKPVLALPQGVILGSRPVNLHVTQDEANPARTYVEIQQLVDGKWKKFSGKEYQGTNAFDFTVDAKALGLLEGVTTQLKVSTWDKTGLHASATANVTIDLTGPNVTWQKQPASTYKIDEGFHVRPITNEVGTTKSVYIDTVTPENLVLTSTGDHKNLDVKDVQNSALWTNLADGNHTFIAVFEDPYGNATIKESASFLLDRSAPVVEFVAPSADSTIKGTATVTVRLDDVNLQAYNLRVDSAGLQYLHQASNGEISFEFDTTTLSDGQHTLLATATDKAGNKTVTTIKVTVDNTVSVSPEPEVVPPFKVTLKVIVIKVVNLLLQLLRW